MLTRVCIEVFARNSREGVEPLKITGQNVDSESVVRRRRALMPDRFRTNLLKGLRCGLGLRNRRVFERA